MSNGKAKQRLDNATKRKRGAQARAKQAFVSHIPECFKHPSELQMRLRTGFVYITISSLSVLACDLTTALMLALVAGICANEFCYILRADAKLPNEMLGVIAAACYPLSIYLWGLIGALAVTVIFVLVLCLWYVFWSRARIADVSVSFFGALYTGLLISGLLLIRMATPDPWGGVVVFLIFVAVWVTDGFAYLVGSKFGKHKLAPRISPKKSWEGFVAGLVGSMLVWWGISLIPVLNMPLWMALLFGFLCGLASVLGDLVESRIKRGSGVKDSGTLMPGHGGLFDRSDSMFPVSVVAAALLVAGGCIPYVGF